MNLRANKVPAVTASFWAIKILATTVGETFADFLSVGLGLGLSLTSYAMGGLLLIILWNQIRLHRYSLASYWLVVVLMSITGTLITDRLIENLGMSLSTISLIFSSILAVIFALWYWRERTLAMHSIQTTRREIFYWAAILFTFALGTAVGDWFAEALRLGYLNAAIIFGLSIATIAIVYHYLWLNAVLAFWLAYILTRPLGASLGDLLSQPRENGGYGLGTVNTSILFLSMIVSLIIYLSQKSREKA